MNIFLNLLITFLFFYIIYRGFKSILQDIKNLLLLKRPEISRQIVQKGADSGAGTKCATDTEDC